MANNVYKAKKFNLSGLQGISDKTLEMHFGLYEGLRQEHQPPHRAAAGDEPQ
jgi:hypothetical protein